MTTPTIGTYKNLIKKNFDRTKIKILYDPIITPSEILKKKKFDTDIKDKYYISIGRLTNQNYKFLIKKFIINNKE